MVRDHLSTCQNSEGTGGEWSEGRCRPVARGGNETTVSQLKGDRVSWLGPCQAGGSTRQAGGITFTEIRELQSWLTSVRTHLQRNMHEETVK